MGFFNRLPTPIQGYIFVIITMAIWGGFSLFARLNAHWGISAWDIIFIRFGVSALILLPIIIYQKNHQFLWSKTAISLAIFGGVGYSMLVYRAFLIAPVAHGAVFLNGMIPVATALLMLFWLKKRPDHDTKIALIIISLTLVSMTALMVITNQTFGMGDGLFVLCAFSWGAYGILVKQSSLTAWQIMCCTAVWSALIYVPIYALFFEPNFIHVKPHHLIIQGVFHSVIVMIVATMTYALAVAKLGAFTAGGIASVAPFISAIVAVPLLGEPLDLVMVVGLVGMSFGVIQPWRFLTSLPFFNKENL